MFFVIAALAAGAVAGANTGEEAAAQQNQAKAHVQALGRNRGLTAAQPAGTMPRSRAALPKGAGQGSVSHGPGTDCTGMTVPMGDDGKSCRLSGGWTLMDGETYLSGNGPGYDAVVPGTVLTTLVAAGVYPDPYFGLNNLLIPDDLCRKDWWYVRDLELTPAQLAEKSIELVFGGVNYAAEVWVNGTRLGTMRGAFRRGRFQLKDVAKEHNTVAVRILPPPNPGIPHEQSLTARAGGNGGQLCMDGPTFICTEGWDWIPGIRDRDMGIWQDVQLVTGSGVRFSDVQVITDLPLPRTDVALITIEGGIESDADHDVRVTARIDGLKADCFCHLASGGRAFTINMTMDKPALWMPNGYGEPNLHTLELDISENGRLLDTRTIRFGVREFSYELTVDTPTRKGLRIDYDPTDIRGAGNIFDNRMLRKVTGDTEVPSLAAGVDEGILTAIPENGTAPYLVLKVNGVPVLCRGGNWGMDDAMKDCSREHLEPYFKLHRHAGFNMVRNWTGESTEEAFYDLCDEYGMLVWNDFWLSTEGWNLDVNDDDLFMENVVDVLLRYRNHPSIAVWCPRNEGYATEPLERRLAEAVAHLDGTRHYSPNSRYSNLRGSGPWNFKVDRSAYFDGLAHGFNTEMGSPSIPTAESIRKFIAPRDLWPISDAWAYHDLHFNLQEYLGVMGSRYGDPRDLDDFCRKAQLMNYDSYRAMLEATGSRMWNSTSGLLLWMSHPAWPSFEWQAYSWDGETFGSFYGCRKACEPLHIQMHPDGSVAIVNTTLKAYDRLVAEIAAFSLGGRRLNSAKETVSAVANAMTPCRIKAVKPAEVSIIRLTLKDASGNVVSINDYLESPDGSFAALDAARAEISIKPGRDGRFTVKNKSGVAAIGVRFNIRDAATGEAVLPAFFSDGCINLLPGESRTLTYSCDAPAGAYISAEGYNL